MSDPTAPLAGIDGASVGALAVERAGDETGHDEDGDVLARLDPDRALTPASNTKLVTSALALEELGPDYTFETRVEGRGERDGDRLAGDLYFRGSGAPDLDAEDLTALAEEVATAVGEVTGDVLLDGTRFADGRYGPGWTVGDRRHAYGAPSSGLALAGNTVEVRITDPEETGEFQVSVAPDSAEIEVETDLDVVAGTSDLDAVEESDESDLRVTTDPDSEAIRVTGALPVGADRTERAPVVRPERHCGLALLDALESAGVSVAGEVRAVESVDSTAIDSTAGPDAEAFACTVESAPVADLLGMMNVSSDNFVAEQLARTVAAERDGEGSWAAWESLATDYLEDCGAAACRLRDGSGLSRYNLVTARGMVGLLARADDAPWAEEFFDSLPAPGEGTLSSRLDGVDGLRAKTGTVTGTSALSGVVRRDEESDVFFSVVYGGLTVEADEARRRQDEFVRELSE